MSRKCVGGSVDGNAGCVGGKYVVGGTLKTFS